MCRFNLAYKRKRLIFRLTHRSRSQTQFLGYNTKLFRKAKKMNNNKKYQKKQNKKKVASVIKC